MAGRHMRRDREVATRLGAPRVARHTPAADEDLDDRSADPDVGPFADEGIRDAVVVAVDLDVVVDADLGPLPGGELVGQPRVSTCVARGDSVRFSFQLIWKRRHAMASWRLDRSSPAPSLFGSCEREGGSDEPGLRAFSELPC